MLKTNSKIVRQKVCDFIKQNSDYELSKIYACFLEQEGNYIRRGETLQEAFQNWISGIPEALDVYQDLLIYDNAKKLISEWLEETPKEAERYNGWEAYKLGCYLIFAECQKAYYKKQR